MKIMYTYIKPTFFFKNVIKIAFIETSININKKICLFVKKLSKSNYLLSLVYTCKYHYA